MVSGYMTSTNFSLENSWVVYGANSSQYTGQAPNPNDTDDTIPVLFNSAVIVNYTNGGIPQLEDAHLLYNEPVNNESSLTTELDQLASKVDKLIKNASSFAAMKGAMECLTYFGWVKNKLPLSSYSTLLKETVNDSTTSSPGVELDQFYVTFCRKLEDPTLDLSFFGKVVAKVSFHFMQLIFYYILEDFRTAIENDVTQIIKSTEGNDFEELKALIFMNLERYVGKLTESYKQASIPRIYDENGVPIKNDPTSINKAAGDLLSDPTKNSGYKEGELYKAFTDWLFSKYKPSSHLRQVLIHDLKSIHFRKDSFLSKLDPTLSYLMNALSFLVSLFLGPAEKKLDILIQDYVKKFLSQKLYIENFIQEHLSVSEEDKKKTRIQFLDFLLKFLQEESDPNLRIRHLPHSETMRVAEIIKSIVSFLKGNREVLKQLIPFDPEPTQESPPSGYIIGAASNVVGAVSSVLGAATGVNLSAPLHDYSHVLELIVSALTSVAESAIATNLQKKVILDKSLQLVDYALQTLSTMKDDVLPVEDDVLPVSIQKKSVGIYLREILDECVKITTHTPEQIKLSKVHSMLTQIVPLVKAETGQFLKDAYSYLSNIENYANQVKPLTTLINKLPLDLKEIIKKESTNPPLGEENLKLLIDFENAICQLLNQNTVLEELKQIDSIFTNANIESSVLITQLLPHIQRCRETIDAIAELHDRLVVPTLVAPSYYHMALNATAPALLNSTFEDIAKPLLNVVLDPTNHIYGAAHPLMIGALGPKKPDELKV